MADINGVVKTDWGYELVWANTEYYCGKILVFEHSGSLTPMLLHQNKTKSWFVNQGNFIVRWIDTTTGLVNEQELRDGDTLQIEAMKPHQLESCVPNGSITEVSTPDIANDVLIISN